MAKTKRLHSINMLFIGNSFTQRNNVPGLLAEMAAARNVGIKYELISVGGASLRTHWNAGRAARGHRDRWLPLRRVAGAKHRAREERQTHGRERAAVR